MRKAKKSKSLKAARDIEREDQAVKKRRDLISILIAAVFPGLPGKFAGLLYNELASFKEQLKKLEQIENLIKACSSREVLVELNVVHTRLKSALNATFQTAVVAEVVLVAITDHHFLCMIGLR